MFNNIRINGRLSYFFEIKIRYKFYITIQITPKTRMSSAQQFARLVLRREDYNTYGAASHLFNNYIYSTHTGVDNSVDNGVDNVGEKQNMLEEEAIRILGYLPPSYQRQSMANMVTIKCAYTEALYIVCEKYGIDLSITDVHALVNTDV